MKTMTLSIIVVNCNTPELTLECLRSVYQFRPACPFEVFLVDNGPEKMDPEPVLEFPGLRWIRTGGNLGFSQASNLGMQSSLGEFIVLLNSDTRLIEPSFDRMLAYMKQDEHVGALGPREVDAEKHFRLSCGDFPTFLSELTRKMKHDRLTRNDRGLRDHLDSQYAAKRKVDWVSGFCMMLRRAALWEAGLLDENFFMYFEDIDLCSRLRKKKWEVHYFPGTSVVHSGGGSVRNDPALAMTEYRRSQIYFARKYYSWLGETGIRVFLLLKYAVGSLVRFPVFVFKIMTGKTTGRSYESVLLLPKILKTVFTSVASRPAEPGLEKPF